MGSSGIVLAPPVLNQDLSLPIQQFLPSFAIEALDGAILHWAAWLNEQRSHLHLRQPVSDTLRRELGTIVRADVSRHAAQREQPAECLQDVLVIHPPLEPHQQRFSRVLVDDVQDPIRRAVVRPVVDEVAAPDVVGKQRPQTNGRPIV